jgi:hypothetical protein
MAEEGWTPRLEYVMMMEYLWAQGGAQGMLNFGVPWVPRPVWTVHRPGSLSCYDR